MLQVVAHSINELLCLAAPPERAIGELEFVDCFIQNLDGIAGVEGRTEKSLLNIGRITKVL
jgi:hypothetical protein